MSLLVHLRRIDHPSPDGLPPPEVKVVTAWRVSCDGGQGALGHPRVWYTIPREQGYVDCGYCDARFVHREYLDGSREDAKHPVGETPALHDHLQPADTRGDVLGAQPGQSPDEGDAGANRGGNDGAAGREGDRG